MVTVRHHRVIEASLLWCLLPHGCSQASQGYWGLISLVSASSWLQSGITGSLRPHYSGVCFLMVAVRHHRVIEASLLWCLLPHGCSQASQGHWGLITLVSASSWLQSDITGLLRPHFSGICFLMVAVRVVEASLLWCLLPHGCSQASQGYWGLITLVSASSWLQSGITGSLRPHFSGICFLMVTVRHHRVVEASFLWYLLPHGYSQASQGHWGLISLVSASSWLQSGITGSLRPHYSGVCFLMVTVRHHRVIEASLLWCLLPHGYSQASQGRWGLISLVSASSWLQSGITGSLRPHFSGICFLIVAVRHHRVIEASFLWCLLPHGCSQASQGHWGLITLVSASSWLQSGITGSLRPHYSGVCFLMVAVRHHRVIEASLLWCLLPHGCSQASQGYWGLISLVSASSWLQSGITGSLRPHFSGVCFLMVAVRHHRVIEASFLWCLLPHGCSQASQGHWGLISLVSASSWLQSGITGSLRPHFSGICFLMVTVRHHRVIEASFLWCLLPHGYSQTSQGHWGLISLVSASSWLQSAITGSLRPHYSGVCFLMVTVRHHRVIEASFLWCLTSSWLQSDITVSLRPHFSGICFLMVAVRHHRVIEASFLWYLLPHGCSQASQGHWGLISLDVCFNSWLQSDITGSLRPHFSGICFLMVAVRHHRVIEASLLWCLLPHGCSQASQGHWGLITLVSASSWLQSGITGLLRPHYSGVCFLMVAVRHHRVIEASLLWCLLPHGYSQASQGHWGLITLVSASSWLQSDITGLLRPHFSGICFLMVAVRHHRVIEASLLWCLLPHGYSQASQGHWGLISLVSASSWLQSGITGSLRPHYSGICFLMVAVRHHRVIEASLLWCLLPHGCSQASQGHWGLISLVSASSWLQSGITGSLRPHYSGICFLMVTVRHHRVIEASFLWYLLPHGYSQASQGRWGLITLVSASSWLQSGITGSLRPHYSGVCFLMVAVRHHRVIEASFLWCLLPHGCSNPVMPDCNHEEADTRVMRPQWPCDAWLQPWGSRHQSNETSMTLWCLTAIMRKQTPE